MAREIIYEPHPVSAERKAELMAQGFRILDAKFAPAVTPKAETPKVETVVVEPVAAPTKKRGRPAKVASEAQISDKPSAPSED